jgi:DNA-binding MarR family transcriptional regulator
MDALRLALRGSDVTNSQYFIPRCMLDLPHHRASPSDLSRATGETRSNTTRICEALFQHGWVRRVYSDTDRRRVDMSMTRAGKDFTEGLIAKVKAYQGATEVFFSLTESAEMARMLLRLEAALARTHRP